MNLWEIGGSVNFDKGNLEPLGSGCSLTCLSKTLLQFFRLSWKIHKNQHKYYPTLKIGYCYFLFLGKQFCITTWNASSNGEK